MNKPIHTFLLYAGLTILTSTFIHAQPGSLDLSFNSIGTVTTAVGAGDDKGYAVIQQSDDKLVVVGLSSNGLNNDFAVIRYNIDGSLDPSFGIGGTVTTPIGPGSEAGQSVIQQVDDKILVAGFTSNGTDNDFALVRYNVNGSLDNTFGFGGLVSTPIGSSVDQSHSLALQTDGKIVVAGFTNNGTDFDFALARYNINGSLDLTFDTDGIVTTDFDTSSDVGRSVTIQTDGKIVVAGWTSNGTDLDFALARYNTNGSLDLTFDTDGKVNTPIGAADDQGFSVILQTDGKILVSGVAANVADKDFATARYNTDGSLDFSFDVDGHVASDFSSGDDYGYSVALQANGKILVAGQSINGLDNDFGLARYNPDGSPDLFFDTDGKVTTNMGGNGDVGWSVTVQSDGRAVVTGSGSLSNFDIATARYNVCDIIDTLVLQTATTLTSNSSTGTYQWINCDSANASIIGEINQTYTITSNGNYAVIVDVGGCADTSACYLINTFGISENGFANTITIYPNPTSGQLILSMSKPLNNGSIRLVNLTGQTILKKENQTGNMVTLDISDQASGIYYIEITEGINVVRSKVVKK